MLSNYYFNIYTNFDNNLLLNTIKTFFAFKIPDRFLFKTQKLIIILHIISFIIVLIVFVTNITKIKYLKYKVKKKPKLSKQIEDRLKLRREIKKRKPKFLREEWFRYKRIPKNWRRPDGISSKMRINLKYRPSKVRVGFRVPKDVRGFHSSGFQEVIVYNIYDLEGIDPKKQAVRIGGSVGTKKRIDIEKKAEELDVRILNI